MNLMKDRFDNMESWEDIENNIEGSTSEKYPSSNRERFVNVSKTFYKFLFSISTDPDKPITAAEAATRQNVRFAAV